MLVATKKRMTLQLTSAIIALLISTTPALAQNQKDSLVTPPKANKVPHVMTEHGDTRTDNYYWLRDDSRKDPKVLDYLNAENAYTESVMKEGKALEETLFNEMVSRMAQNDESVPYIYNGYTYRTIYQEGKDFPIYQRKPVNSESEWEVLVDGNERAKGHEFYQLGDLTISPDNKRIAIAEDKEGRRNYNVAYKDLSDNTWKENVLTNISANLVWANDSKTLFYVDKDPQTLLPYQIYRHQYGTDRKQDVKIFEENDDRFYTWMGKSKSEDYILVSIESSTTSESRLIDANAPEKPMVIFSARQEGREYDIDHFNGEFYIRSNHESELFGLYKTASIDKPWKTVIAPQKDVDLEGFDLFNRWLVVEERKQGLVSLRQIDWKTGQSTNVTFDDPVYMAWLGFNPQADSEELRFGYTSMTTPSSTYQWNMQTHQKKLLKQQEVKGFERDLYESERIWVKAQDGVEVPVSLVYRKDLFKKGENPILIYGYGSYGSSIDPSFSSPRLSLLDRGFVYAIVHVRGGGELGKRWYNQGKMEHKVNTFTDFIDATKYLIAEGYGAPKHVYAMGGSAGGLLMGAVVNMAPELYRGVVSQVPFVDVVTTMLDASIPLTTGEYEEWGNPADKDVYFRLKSYSPYDNVVAKAYPHLLVTTGLHDSQVQYWEPAKWVAKLRELKTDNNLLLLDTNMSAGHGGKSGRFNRLRDTAKEYAFILMLEQPEVYFKTQNIK
ncbi:S9 family peptidase [Proteus penneri]|uniref:S9 family peptidase n=1 Tax=Proteus penneri TaxID=102862 RepID=A0ABS0W1J9_9GAMM|nr:MULTISPECIES: S9 family peptidase [Proteus]MBJ2116765.1 S9 family peptidase [Proteus penneri]MCO8050760.1 S9 family peptidase [Proteus penneri]MCX2589371.1 S9 family peptidase [Proteus penneri]NBL78182.1 prolyl oligopeptidase family serine peptidase [Proteus sp. G2672]NBM04503.1 prolyl oligopeptidase family serine peptidase [Proteus sp. G2671]